MNSSSSLVRFVLLAALGVTVLTETCHAQNLGTEFRSDYSLTDLGQVNGLPVRQGGLVLQRGASDTLLIGGSANSADGKLYSVNVLRDDQKNIAELGRAQYYAEAPFNDGGLCYAPNGVLFCAQWPANNLGQLKPGSRVPDRVIDLGPNSEVHSLASVNFFMPTGHLKMLTWRSGKWFDAEVDLLPDGTYQLLKRKQMTTLGGGPEGFVFVPEGSPQFAKPSVLVAEWTAGNIVAYEITADGDPIGKSRRVFVAGLKGAEGGMIDPLTGDYLFTTFGGGDRVLRVDGLNIPPDDGHGKLYPKQRVLRIRQPEAEPPPADGDKPRADVGG